MAEIEIYNDSQLYAAIPQLGALPKIAKEKGLSAFTFYYHDDNLGPQTLGSRDGYYFVVCQDEKTANDMRSKLYLHKDQLSALLDDISVDRDVLNTQCTIFPIDIAEDKRFVTFQRCMRNVVDMETVKAAYGQYGYRPPEWVARSTMDAIHTFIAKRYAQDVPDNLKQIQEEAFHKFIDRSVKNYKKNNPLRHKILRPHEVHRDYFIKNHITAINTTVTGDLWAYIRSRWDECPEFVTYKETTPYEAYKDRRDMGKKMNDMYPSLDHYWDDLIGYKKYRMSYPIGFDQQVKAWTADYYAERMKWKFITPFDSLDKERPLHRIVVDGQDLDNWASLCTANNVMCAINHGEMGEVGNLNNFVFIYQDKDSDMVKAIQNRLVNETMTLSGVPAPLSYIAAREVAALDAADAKYAEKQAKREERWNKTGNVIKRVLDKHIEEDTPNPVDHEVVRGYGYESGWDL